MENHEKIKKLEELAKILQLYRSQNKKIIHCHGVFDLLHIGHIRHLEQSRRMGDILVVTITPDRYVDKGPHRPAFTEGLRAEAIASLTCVNYVAINQWPTAEETLRLLRPDIYVKGSEFKNTASDTTGKITREEQVIREIGASLVFTEDIVFSSSNLINRFFSNFSDEMNEYLSVFRQRYRLQEILGVLDRMASLNVLVIGDTILDEYQYCEAIGKSSKDPVLAVKYKSHDLFAGGVLAIANHVANFAKSVQLVTVLGEQNSCEEFIRSQLQPNISPYFVLRPGAPTLIKRRFVEGYSLNKLFEVYVMDDSGLSPQENGRVCDWLAGHIANYDVVIAADFGHGTIGNEMIRTLINHSKFLAVNTQANAGNRGFNTISRYPHADYVCLAEHEVRLETRNLSGPLRPIMEEMVRKMNCKRFVVTRGRKGAYASDDQGEFIAVPSFAQSVVDRVGAGDAFFSLTSLAAVQSVSIEILAFIGNAIGSLAVEILGNKKPVDKLSVQKYIAALMK
jgi:cytidyltransferase-like protein